MTRTELVGPSRSIFAQLSLFVQSLRLQVFKRDQHDSKLLNSVGMTRYDREH